MQYNHVWSTCTIILCQKEKNYYAERMQSSNLTFDLLTQN